tara:strand:- start:398 stop:1363 length:966 start_codon:yes stop_codon:yes gene_type:complete
MLLKQSFKEHLEKSKHINLHYYLNNIYTSLPKINEIPNIIIYGPSGSGKYILALKFIEKYSYYNLKYEKKFIINHNKQDYTIKISDIHYEIDIELLGCNTKTLLNEIYNNILDIILSSSKQKFGIILLKNFDKISNELLDVIYSYMQRSIYNNIIIKFIILTDNLSFIPNNILNSSKIMYVSHPKKSNYSKINKKYKFDNIDYIDNINFINLDIYKQDIVKPYISICNILIEYIINPNNIDIIKLRNTLYDLLVYNVSIPDSIFYILKTLIEKNYLTINNLDIGNLYEKTCIFLLYYNNNYRPIFHLESYILYLIKLVNEL